MNQYPDVSEHRVFFFFPFRSPNDSSPDIVNQTAESVLGTQLSDLLKLPFLPSAVKGKDRAIAVPQKIWRPAKAQLSRDLHSHIHMLLGDIQPGKVDKHDDLSSPPLHELIPEARNVLTGRWGTGGPGLEITLSEKARHRLGTPADQEMAVRIVIEAGYIQFFRTGIGVLILESSYRCAAEGVHLAEVILEANHRLSHVQQGYKHGLAWATRSVGDALVPSLDSLAHALVTCGAGEIDAPGASLGQTSIEWPRDSRVFIYTAVQFKKPFADGEARRQFAYRLCNKYTSDYSVHEGRGRSTLVSAFENVLHGASIEGGCAVVEEAGTVEFLETYISKAVRQVYIPLALISFHEFRHLLRLTQESALYVSCERPSEPHIAILGFLRNELLNFHLFFRFSHASMISHHNLAHQAWRQAFDLDRMLREVTSDVIEAEKVLSGQAERLKAIAEREKERQAAVVQEGKERRWRIWSTVGTWVATYFALSHLLEIWVKKAFVEPKLQLMTLKVFNKLASVAEFAARQTQYHELESILEGVAVVVAIAVAAIVYHKSPSGAGKRHDHP